MQWTDGCATQYKCSNVLGGMVENFEEDFGYPVERNYFEVRMQCYNCAEIEHNWMM